MYAKQYTYYAYIESTVSPAFQFIPFKTQGQTAAFVKSINDADNTLKATEYKY